MQHFALDFETALLLDDALGHYVEAVNKGDVEVKNEKAMAKMVMFGMQLALSLYETIDEYSEDDLLEENGSELYKFLFEKGEK